MKKQLMEVAPQEKKLSKYPSVKKFADEMNVPPGPLYEKFRNGDLPCLRFGKKILIDRDAVVEAMKAGVQCVVNLAEVRQHLLHHQTLTPGTDFAGHVEAVDLVMAYEKKHPCLQRGRRAGNGDGRH